MDRSSLTLTIKEPLSHQLLQDSILIREVVYTLRHLMSSLDAGLEEEVNQVEVVTSMSIPLFVTLHTKNDSGWQQIRVRVLTSGIPGTIIGS